MGSWLIYDVADGRAGGGGSSSSGDGGEIGLLIDIIIWVMRVLPFPLNVIVSLGVVAAFFYYRKKFSQSSLVLTDIPENMSGPSAPISYATLKPEGDQFKEAAFLQKVSKAFTEVQEAWAAGDLGPSRPYISDAVYQRFASQQKMMAQLKQKNILGEVRIQSAKIVSYEQEGDYDIITVGFRVSMKDRFESSLDRRLNVNCDGEFIEYWSFLRTQGITTKDMYYSQACPQCSAPLPEAMGEFSKCEACNTLLNTGAYDWVLAEITQARDWASRSKINQAKNIVASLYQRDERFSLQGVEDKASNAYLQILCAKALDATDGVKRFVSDEFMKSMVPDSILYNRLYLNSVTVIGTTSYQGLDHLFIRIQSSYQRVDVDGQTVNILDPFLETKTEVMVMTRDSKVTIPKGSVYAKECPGCGGTLKSTTDVNCPYCQTVVNSTKYDWIVASIMSADEFRAFMDQQNAKVAAAAQKQMDDRMTYRDYALNNVLIVIGADGVFDQREVAYVKKVAGEWGFPKDRLAGLIQEAQAHRLSLKQPQNEKHRQKMLKLMTKAAMADGGMSQEEKAILEQMNTPFRDAA